MPPIVRSSQILQDEARITNTELADRVALSPSACLRRVRSLEEAGVIAGYVALVDPAIDREADHGVRRDLAVGPARGAASTRSRPPSPRCPT